MRRIWVLCVFFLMTAGAAWAATSVARRPSSEHPPASGLRSSQRDSVLFGDKKLEAGAGRDSSGSVKAFRFADKRTGTALSISVYVGPHSRAKTLVVGIFAATAGGPGRLVASGSLSGPKPRAWNTAMIKSVAVKAGSAYWVAVLAKGGTLYFRERRNGSCISESYAKVHFTALRASGQLSSVKGRQSHACPISAYVSGRLSASGRGAPKKSGNPNTVTNPPPPSRFNTGLPVISGTAQEGDTLTTTNGTWSNSPTSYSYQWQACSAACTNITGATGSSYVLQASDVGKTIDVVVTATTADGSGSATSPQTQTVTAPGTEQSIAFWLAWSGAIQESQIPWNAVTQVDLFALKTTDGTALDATSNGLSNMNVSAWVSMIHQHGKLAMISIGGSNDQDWVDACNTTNVSGFTTNLVHYMVSNGFDGVDIDIESSPSNWATCVQAIYNAAHAATTQAGKTPIVSTDVDESYMDSDVAKFYQYADQFNLMYYGDPAGSWNCGAGAPYGTCATVNTSVQKLHTTGHVPYDQMVLGFSPGGGQAQCCYKDLATTNALVSGPIMSIPVSSIPTAIPAGNIVLTTTQNPPTDYQWLTTSGAAACSSDCSIPITGAPSWGSGTTANYSYPSDSYVQNAYAGPWDCGNFARYAAANGLEGVMIWDLQEEAGQHNNQFPCFNQVAPYIASP